jgi:hypothetical protein
MQNLLLCGSWISALFFSETIYILGMYSYITLVTHGIDYNIIPPSVVEKK